MPKVTVKIRISGLLVFLVIAGNVLTAVETSKDADASTKPGPAQALYEELRTVGLDSSRVYRVRDASIDRASLHISLNDGTIAFTQDVAGQVTGAFFAGDGEVLLSPPDQIERSSMALFTGAAILEEKFTTAYLRFNDDMFKELEPSLRPTENPQAFIAQWNDSARNLAQNDALRLLTSFSRLLPVHKSAVDRIPPSAFDPNDRMLHLRVQGQKLGVFDLFFDLAAWEQISAGQIRMVDGKSNYDVWTSFAFRKEPQEKTSSEIAGEEAAHGSIEVLKYKISAEITLPTHLDAEARLQVLVHHGGDRALLFELSRYLKVRQVEADGRAIEFIHNQALEGTELERRGDDLVAIIFPEPLRAGQSIELRFSYGGAVLSEAGGGLLYVGARGTWYPNRGFSKAMFDLDFRYPTSWTLVASGERQAEKRLDGAGAAESVLHGTQESRWVSRQPIPIAGFNLGRYSRATKHAGPVTVDVYAASGMERSFPQLNESEVLPQPPVFPPRSIPILVAPLPPSPAGNAHSVGDDAARAVTFFASYFGPYPYGNLAITQMPGTLSQGWPGLIFLSSFSFLTSDQKSALHMSPVEQTISEGVIAHETAHQWWGDLVTWSGYRDQWIAEALANYSSLLLLESQDPRKFRALMAKYRDDLLQKDKNNLRLMEAGPVSLGARLSSSRFPDGYETIAYERGTWLFHMLRTLMRDAEQKSRASQRAVASDEPFLQALHTLRERYQTKPITTTELIRIFEEHLSSTAWHEGRRSLDWFYQGWVNGTSIPGLELHGLKYLDNSTSTLVSGTIKQKDAPEDLITSVPLYASVAGRTMLMGRVFADGPETQFHLTAPRGTRKVLLDPNQTVLSRPR